MQKNVVIPLPEPISGHRGPIVEVELRPPVWGDVMGVGSPYTVHRDKEDRAFLVYDEAAIAHYAEALVVNAPALLFEKAPLSVTLQVREAIVDFFLAAERAAAGSMTSPKSCGSTAGSPPTPSPA